MNYPYRYIARFLIEADTPLAVGSGDSDILTDAPISQDCNGLPMIPGASLCGVLRHSLLARTKPGVFEYYQTMVDEIFGCQDKEGGKGGRLVVSGAHLVGESGQVIDGIMELDEDNDFYRLYTNLPIRQHCRIMHRGTADIERSGKFDNHVVYKGSRFVFELELAGDTGDQPIWEDMITVISSPLFRIGGGTRKGYGAIKVKAVKKDIYNLGEPEELQGYLARNSILTASFSDSDNITCEGSLPKGITSYKLTLKPDDFFMFGSGFGDEEVDIAPVVETVINWKKDGKLGTPSNEMTLIPASSIKGALSHRIAFHYNRRFGNYIYDTQSYVGEENAAVFTLFGCASDAGSDTGGRGRVILSDMYLETTPNKILNHVAIDRFTQGALDGALFNERVLTGGKFTLELLVENIALENEEIKGALEDTLNDIVTGMLPLGGGVMRGHGAFNGAWKKEQSNE